MVLLGVALGIILAVIVLCGKAMIQREVDSRRSYYTRKEWGKRE